MNVKNRIARILTALSRCDTSRGDGRDNSYARLARDANGTVHLPADATPAERRMFEQLRSMWWTMLPPSFVTSELFVED